MESRLLAPFHMARHTRTTQTRFTIVTGRKRTARRRHCIGTTHPCQAANHVTEGDQLQHSSEAVCASKVGSCTALTHSVTAQRARPKRASSVKPVTPSATGEVVRTTAVLWLHRTRQLRASGDRAASFSCSSLRKASRSQPMQPEAQDVVWGVLSGLRAEDTIGRQHMVAKR